ncbi:pyridoxal phosphate-dependent aminotransferase [Halorussus salilacus]|uniref:pyridoxal phosphate-dependent aminotransferase n=1 Tax=Halorussus salilacus TaxID=2953750 RepID=UPI0020A21387|nr:pyridoxal phosphate-dependent aminotransferase [Halorussus salilacus]USZ68637.1 pyridoxal phosphate-dependent aminotransferase [Halorussus salilacus]
MVSERATRTTPFAAMDVLERANRMDDVIHLEVGEPDFETPPAVTEAAVAALRAGETGYTSSKGKPELRNAISDYYDRRYGVDVAPERIVVTSGSSPALLLAFSALVDPGDEVVLTDPHYACYPNFVRQTGGRISTVPLSAEEGFRPRVEAFQRAVSDETEALLVNSPANPTGAVLDGPTLDELVGIADRADATVISDEVYHGLTYEGEDHTVLEYTDDAFVLDGFSKRFAMTGWRLGWMVAPPDYVGHVNRIAQNTLICAPNFVQSAGIAALGSGDDFLDEVRETYRERRDFLVDAVDEWDMSMGYTPGGAYYLLVDVSDLPGDAFDAADFFLEDAGVAMTPGPDFGANAAECLRVSYANSEEKLREASERIQRALERVEISAD